MEEKFQIDLSNNTKAMQVVEKELLSGYGQILGSMLRDYGYDLKRFVVTVVNAMKKNPKLIQCTKESLLSGVLASAQLGLEIDSEFGYCYLIPYVNKKGNCMEAKFIVGYKGIIELLYRSPHVLKVDAKVVYEKDYFLFEEGFDTKLEHKRFIGGNSGKRLGAYALVKLANGEKQAIWCPEEEIEALRKKSSTPSTYDFENDPTGNMWKKAPLRQIIKYVPKQSVPSIARIDDFDDKVLSVKDDQVVALPAAMDLGIALENNDVFADFLPSNSTASVKPSTMTNKDVKE